ncbi:MAG: hypothetical protein HKL80_09430 [Acidimicrobiales bacterium]|nr:hypothetical protein [Acidimicrobiales bacterium]
MAPEPDNKWLSPEMQLPILRDKALNQDGSGNIGGMQPESHPENVQEDLKSTNPKNQVAQNALSGAVVAPIEIPQFELPHFDRVDQGRGRSGGGNKKFAIFGGIGGALLIIILLIVLLSGGSSPSSNTTATTLGGTTVPTGITNTTVKTKATTITTLPGTTTQPVSTTTATTTAPGNTTSPQPVVTASPTTNPPPAPPPTFTTTTIAQALPFTDTITMKTGSMTASSYSVGSGGGKFILSNQTSSTQTVYVNSQGYSVPPNSSGQAPGNPASSYVISATPLGQSVRITVN